MHLLTSDQQTTVTPPEQARASWSIARAFRRCADLWPQQLAASDGANELTFGELDRRVDAVAARLHGLGVRRGDHVLLLGGKDLGTLIALLAISRVGAVFVPVASKVPKERMRFYLEDAAPRLVIGRESLLSLVTDVLGETFPCLALEALPSDTSAERVEAEGSSPEDVAYIIYTSGSTGFPKGVQIDQRNVQAFFKAHNERVQIRPGDRCMNTGPFHFDVAIMDVLLPLCLRAAVLLTPETPMPTLLLAALERHRITHTYAVGTVLNLMTGDGSMLDRYDLSSLRVLQTGAEVCNPTTVNHWTRRNPQLQVLNSYGPTEVTVGCVSYLKAHAGPLPATDVPIGLAHTGKRIAIMAEDGTLIEGRGVTGELLLAGDQVMRGYYNRPLENKRAFVELNGERYYRTGDFVWTDAEGRLRYVGRRDDEIKVNGHRVHLNEIRRCLAAHGEVRAAAVGLVPDEAQKPRVACVLASRHGNDAGFVERVLAHLAAHLPSPLCPTIAASTVGLPQMPSGKTEERRALDALARAVERHGGTRFVDGAHGFVPLHPGA